MKQQHTSGPWFIRSLRRGEGPTGGVVVGGKMIEYTNGQSQQQVAMRAQGWPTVPGAKYDEK